MEKETPINYLISKGIRADLVGFRYLVTILEKVSKENILFYKVTDLYKNLADSFNTNIYQVEKAIRYIKQLAGHKETTGEFIINLMIDYYNSQVK